MPCPAAQQFIEAQIALIIAERKLAAGLITKAEAQAALDAAEAADRALSEWQARCDRNKGGWECK